MEKLFYKDKFVELHHDKIILKCYYFPIAKSKMIPLNDIQSVYYDSQENSMIFTIGWGITIFGVWWGFDLKRQFPSFKTKYSNVILDNGTAIKKGFTVVDINEFLKALQMLLTNNNVSFVNKISDKYDKNVTAKTSSLLESEKAITSWKERKIAHHSFGPHFCINMPLPSYEEAIKQYYKNE